MAQRWLVVCSEAAMERAETSVSEAQRRELDAIDKQGMGAPRPAHA